MIIRYTAIKKVVSLVLLGCTFLTQTQFGQLLVPRAHAALDEDENEYQMEVGPIVGSTIANYTYASFFNPSASVTVVIKRLQVVSEAVGAGVYVNLSTRRISADTGGTLVDVSEIPKKNNDSIDPVIEIRHTGSAPTFDGSTQSRLLSQTTAALAGSFYGTREIVFGSNDEKIVLQPGEGIAVYQEAAGTANQRVRVLLEWEEVTVTPSAQGEYMLAFERVENAAGTNYMYSTFFNATSSGKTALIKRVWFGAETCDTGAIYTNELTINRISSASGGTPITAADIPKKNTSSANSAMDIRYTGVTATLVGGVDARIGHATPCGVAGQPHGWNELNLHSANEWIVLKPGEGIAFTSDITGDVDQLNRLFVEWKEIDSVSTPEAQNEYIWASDKIIVGAALGTNFYTFFNPVGSGKAVEIKRLSFNNDVINTATYSNLNFQRISTSTGGALITASDLPKKHASSSDSKLEVRWCGATCGSAITTNYVGNRSIVAAGISDSGLFKVTAPVIVGHVIGKREIVFGHEEPLILQEGEGIGMYLNYLAGNNRHYYKVNIEWGEVDVVPTPQNQYLIDIGPMPGNTAATYSYATFFNPATSSKATIVKRVSVRVDTIAGALYIPMRVRRISDASAGTLIDTTDIPKKHSSSSDSVMDIRRTGVTTTFTQSTDAQLISVITPGAAGTLSTPGISGYKELIFANDHPVVLMPGEGIALSQDSVGDVDFRVRLLVEWQEVDLADVPVATNEYAMSVGPITGSLVAGYVYATIRNPASSTVNYLIKRLGMRVNRAGNLSNPGYVSASVRRITNASAGTLISPDNILKKHSSSSTSTAEVRTGGVIPTYLSATSSRFLVTLAPGAVQQRYGTAEEEVTFGDEIVLKPGEGIALYQETNAGDVNLRYQLFAVWEEVAPIPQTLTFSISDNTVGFGTLSAGETRYATGDNQGTSTDSSPAHTISASTNGDDGYVIYVSGSTLTCVACGGATITAIGETATTATMGIEQFGLRATVASGTAAVSAPYSSSNWALDTASFPDTLAVGLGDGLATEFGLRYMSNIASNSEAGDYSASLTYVVTASF